MAGRRLTSVALLLVCTGISLWWGVLLWRSFPGGTVDFQGVYYGTRCLMAHCDPYHPKELEDYYVETQKASPPDSMYPPYGSMWFIYPPTTCLLVAPIALLHWKAARLLWFAMLVACYVTAAWLIWNKGKKHSEGVSLLLVAWILANSEVLFGGANPAGFAVSLCVFAVCFFLEERLVLLGVVGLSVSLALKPHDGGLIWLYFLLAGGAYRRRALQVMGVVAVLGAASAFWVAQLSPNWMHEWHDNLTAITANGRVDDPGSLTPEQMGMTGPVIDLQSVVALFRDDAGVYNPVAYGICGVMLLLWVWITVRRRGSRALPWLALAAVVPITMLVTYHRPYDAKLLLLVIPACAMLWAKGGKLGWGAFAVTLAGVILTSDLPISILMVVNAWVQPAVSTMTGKLEVLVLTRVPSLVLLAMAVFYLWVYARRAGDEARGGEGDLQLSRHYRGYS